MDAPKTPLDRLADLTKRERKRLPTKIKQLGRQRDTLNVLELYNQLNTALHLLRESKHTTSPTRKETHYAK